jgi:hypothetical protein
MLGHRPLQYRKVAAAGRLDRSDGRRLLAGWLADL